MDGRGFERFYGFLGGETDQWFPWLTYDNHYVSPPKTPEQGYHCVPDLVDKAKEFIADTRQGAPDRPFFMYFCPGTAHAPHHVPTDWIAKYKGKFDAGWDDYREKALANQAHAGNQRIGTVLILENADSSSDDLHVRRAASRTRELENTRVEIAEDGDVLDHAVLRARHGERGLRRVVSHVDREASERGVVVAFRLDHQVAGGGIPTFIDEFDEGPRQ